MRYGSTFSAAGMALIFTLSVLKPEIEAEARLLRNDPPWSDVRVAQRKPWADEVMEAIGRGQNRSPSQPGAQPQGQGREQPGRGAQEGSGAGIQGGQGAGGRDAGRGEGAQPKK